MLKPLESIDVVFSKPANNKYGWVGADSVKVIVLQDFRWSRDMIAWGNCEVVSAKEPVFF